MWARFNVRYWGAGVERRDRPGGQLALWLAFGVMVAVRFPYLLQSPAFYAEEAFYYQSGLFRDGIDQLGWSYAGYVSVFANTAGEIASWFPLEAGPTAMRVLGLFGPATVVAVIISSSTSMARRLGAIAVVVFTSLLVIEWPSVIHAQFWFGVAVFVLLGVSPRNRWGAWWQRALVGLAAVSSPVATMAAPAFGIEALRRRSWHLLLLTAQLGLGAWFQLLQPSNRHPSWPVSQYIAAFTIENLSAPLLGNDGGPINSWVADNWWRWPVAIVCLVTLTLVIGSAIWAVSERWRVVIGGATFAGAVALWFALPPYENMFTYGWGERYAVVSAVSVGVALVLGVRWHRRAAVVATLVPAVMAVHLGLTSGVAYIATASNRADIWADSIPAALPTPAVTPTCRLRVEGPAATDQFTVTETDAGLKVTTTGSIDENRRWFVLVSRATSLLQAFSAQGWSPPVSLIYGNGDTACYASELGVLPPADPAINLTDDGFIIPSATWASRPDGIDLITVAYGTDMAEALAMGRYEIIAVPRP